MARRTVPGVIGLIALTAGAAGLGACATTAAVGRGGQVYEIRVATVDGMPTSLRGPAGHPACVVQVANQVATVWLAQPSHQEDQVSPVIFEADAEALKGGILVERSWNQAVVHEVTDAELAAGAAVVYIPGVGRPTTVELRFDPTSTGWRLSHSGHKDDLAKHRPVLEQPVGGSDVR